MKDTLRQIANLVTVLIALTVNILASVLPLNGQNTGEISDRFQVYFVPAGYVFAIWGIIYIGLIAYAVYQALPSQKDNPRLQATGWWVVLGGLANSTWIFLWHYLQFVGTLGAMLILLATFHNIVRLDLLLPGGISPAWLEAGSARSRKIQDLIGKLFNAQGFIHDPLDASLLDLLHLGFVDLLAGRGGQGLDELALSVPLDAGDPDDLPAVDVEARALERPALADPHAHVLDRQHDLLGDGGLSRLRRGELAADHELGELTSCLGT